MSNNFYGAVGLIGGAAGDLDNIDGTGLADFHSGSRGFNIERNKQK